VWHIGHDGGAEAHRARLDRREEHRVTIAFPQRIAPVEQGLHLRVHQLAAHCTTAGTTAGDNNTVDDQDGADGHLSSATSSLSLDQRFAHVGHHVTTG
jgi:hypothetical protein